MNRSQPLTLNDPSWSDKEWAKWEDHLTNVEAKVYKALREYALDGHTEVDLRAFASSIGVRPNTLARALQRLGIIGLLADVDE